MKSGGDDASAREHRTCQPFKCQSVASALARHINSSPNGSPDNSACNAIMATAILTLEIDPLFHEPVEFLTTDERVALSYKRARLLMHEYGQCSMTLSTP